MNTPKVYSCKVGIPIMKGPLDTPRPDGSAPVECDLYQATFHYIKVSDLLTRCAEAGVYLLEDPKTLKDNP